MHYGNLHVMTHFEVTWQGQRSLEVKLLVIWRQIVIVMVALFQIASAWTGSLRLQPNFNHRCTMGTFTLWRTSRSHDRVKCHFRGVFHQAFSQWFSLTKFISYWNPCIWLAESKLVSENHWQNAWWNAPQVNFTKISINILSEKLLVMVLLHVTF